MVPKDLSQVKPPKINSGSEKVAICPLFPQQTIGKSRESHTGRGSGTTSPCLSFPTRRWGWRSHHSFFCPHTASWALVWWPFPPASPPQAGKAALEGGTQAPIILNTCTWVQCRDWELLFRKRRLSLGRGPYICLGNKTLHMLVFSLRSSQGKCVWCSSAFLSSTWEKSWGIHRCTFPSSTCFMVEVGGPEGSSGRNRQCPM